MDSYLEFERAVNVQACPAGDLHAIASDCALHVSTPDTELLRTQGVLTQPRLLRIPLCAGVALFPFV